MEKGVGGGLWRYRLPDQLEAVGFKAMIAAFRGIIIGNL